MTIDRILKIMNYSFRMLVVKVNGELISKESYKTKLYLKMQKFKLYISLQGDDLKKGKILFFSQ